MLELTPWFLVRSLGGIGLAWAAALALLLIAALRFRKTRPRGLPAVAEPEGGFEYTLNVTVILPMLTLLLLGVVELTSLVTAKLGTVYAAFAVSRSWLAWEVEGPEVAERKAKQAARAGLAPFGLGETREAALVAEASPVPVEIDREAHVWAETYRRAVNGPVADDYLVRLYTHAARATRFEVSTDEPGAITTTLIYDYPIRFEVVGRIFGCSVDPATGRRVWPMTTRITLTRQEVLGEESPFGIAYHPEP